MSNLSFIADLSDRTIISISGEQAESYLHGQVSVATENFDENRGRLAAHCDFKGKMFSCMLVSYYQNKFLISAQKAPAQESMGQLKKYGVFSKVEIKEELSLSIIGIYGKEPIKALSVLFPELTDTHMSACSSEFGQAICFNDSSLRYIVLLTTEALQKLKNLLPDILLSSSSAFNFLEIQAGIPSIEKESISQFVPQMLNLQSLNAIDFDKGCYMGQEVVARTKFLGKNKRAAFILKSLDDIMVCPQTGDIVETELNGNWRRAGSILRTSSSINTNTQDATNKEVVLALAVMPNDTPIGAMVRLKGSGSRMQVIQLPYSLEE